VPEYRRGRRDGRRLRARDPDLWTVRCRDRYGQRAEGQVRLTETRIRITTSAPDTLELTPSEVGGLCVALRDSLLSLGELAGPDGLRALVRAPRSLLLPPPSPRQRVQLHREPRPTAASA
jgi:hypothetical protein